MKVAELKNKKASLIQSAEEIQKKAEAGESLPQEDFDQIKAYLDQADQVSEEIKKCEANEAVLSRLNNASSSISVSKSPKTVVSGPVASVTSTKDLILEDPKKGFKDHKHFFMEVLEVGQGKRISEAHEGLKVLAALGSDEQSTFDDPHGGFLVPEAFMPDPLMTPSENDPTLGRTMSIPMSSPIVRIPARVDKNHTSSVSGGLRVYRTAEGDTPSSSRKEYEQVRLEATKLMGVTHVTDELLQDSPISVAALLSRSFAQEFQSELLDEKINGTGVGQYEGVLNSGCLVTVAKETAQTAATIVAANVFKMRSRCWGFDDAIWLANHDTLPQLAALADANNHVYQPSMREDVPELLMGRPIFYTEYTKTLGTVGDLILCNFSQYLEGFLSPLQSAESTHVRFVNHESTFKFWMRNDGAPWWRTALTPRNSSNTLSPFVTLATRA